MVCHVSTVSPSWGPQESRHHPFYLFIRGGIEAQRGEPTLSSSPCPLGSGTHCDSAPTMTCQVLSAGYQQGGSPEALDLSTKGLITPQPTLLMFRDASGSGKAARATSQGLLVGVLGLRKQIHTCVLLLCRTGHAHGPFEGFVLVLAGGGGGVDFFFF